jgi:Tol biopolymer transport system component
MPLQPGSRLGPYEILSAIGAGGMGEVYRATDTNLKRHVALKVLPQAVASDEERLARFQREAEVLASLNHPNIAHLYGLEKSEGTFALVMELVEGSTLADRIAQGPIPVTEALPIAKQIAEALEGAHEQGIIHRDLKPANVKVRDDGTVKLLDFGLAKAMESPASVSPAVSHSPTLTTPAMTQAGVILGTAAYMSPEQARGQRVDKRTDVWSFGCVVYEMLTGRAAFSGETVPDLIAMVLAREPDLTALPPATPASVRRLLRRCVEKDVRRRLRDIGDARLELDEPPDEPTLARDLGHALPERDVAFKRLTDFIGLKESPAISPDGKLVAFVAFVAGKRQLWIRMLAGGAPMQLTRDPIDHEQPRWAPDSSTLIYYTPPATHGGDGTVWEISALGGWPRRIASAVSAADISRDGRRIALLQASEEPLALVTVARDGSHRTVIATLPAGQGYALPRWSPDGRFIAFQRSSGTGIRVTLEIVSVADGARRPVCQSSLLMGFCWRSNGSGLIYSSSRGSTVLYPPLFNLRTVALDGSADRQLTFGDQSYVEPDTDAAGRLIARRIRSTSDIWKIPVEASPSDNIRRAVRITAQTGQVRTPSPSPDDAEVVYLSDNGGHGNLWISRTDGSAVRQVTFEDDPGVSVGVPKWSPTGDVIAFVMTRGEDIGLWTVHADGSGLRQLVAAGRGPCWSADGKWLYYESGAVGWARLEKVPSEGGESVLVRTEPGSGIPAISPDGAELFFNVVLRSTLLGFVGSDREIRRARPEDGESETLACISNERIPGLPAVLYLTVSPDGAWLAMPLVDGSTTNLWLLPTTGGAMKRITDFGDRSVEIARSISWSADGRHLYAAIADIETDIILLDGLIQ